MSVNGTTYFYLQKSGTQVDVIGYPASHPDTIAVGASSDFDFRSDYSQYAVAPNGDTLDFVAPSGGGRSGVQTTDRSGSAGYADGDYNADFSGTSSSSPLAAGIGALMIGANPTLTAVQVRSLMRATCDKIGNVSYTGGVHEQYGYGRLNAQAALAAALAAVPQVILVQSGGSTAVTEGGANDTYTLALGVAPSSNVIVTAVPDADLAITPSTLVFAPANWSVPQTFTVSAVEDTFAEGVHTGVITHAVTSADPNYNGLSAPSLTATIADNDTLNLVVTPPAVTVSEGQTASFSVRLGAQPAVDVIITSTRASGIRT